MQGVVQISEDGSYVYFVAEGTLAAGAVAGEPNLYVSHDGGTPVFIATLAGERQNRLAGGNTEPKSGAGGQHGCRWSGRRLLAFISEQAF